ncbi:hypothetical protein KEM56_004671 [Ascosphaera pollenicola]|nr:hypothetical protein KEM56_004671 [Ascosphaera pollenicola]
MRKTLGRENDFKRGLVEVGEVGLEGLSKEITTSATTTKKLSEELDRMYDWITQQRTKMEHTELQKQEHSLAALSTLQNRLDELNARDVSSAVNFIDTVLLSLNEMTEAVKTLNQNHNELDLRLQRSEQVFTDLEHLSTSFQQRQLQHLQHQAIIQQSFQKELAMSQYMLNEIKDAAQELKATIDDATDAFSSIAKLGQALKSGQRFIWLGLGHAFVRYFFGGFPLVVLIWLLLIQMAWSMYFHDNIDHDKINAIMTWFEAKKRILWMIGAAVAVGVVVGVYVRSRLRRRWREQAENLPVSEVAAEKGKSLS